MGQVSQGTGDTMSGKRHSRRSRAGRNTGPRFLRLSPLEFLEERRLLAADLLDTSLALAAEFAPATPAAGDTLDFAANLVAMGAPQAWAAGHTGRGVVVAVVDSGVALSHPGLTANLWTNPGEVPGNGRDDDGNGFVDDVSGWDFVGRDNQPDDPNGHGTHIAGTIAGGGEIRGVAPEALLLPVRVLDGRIHGSNADIAAGIRYAVDAGADIINLSIGGPNSATIRSALEYAAQHDVLVVATAGNTKGGSPLFPAAHSASLPNVLSVGAFGNSGALAQFSSRVAGSGAVQVDAPGQDIKSTFVSAPYGYQSGTSMAAPHVSGLAALILAANPGLSAAELRDLIVRGAIRSVPGSDARGGIDAGQTLALAMAGRSEAAKAASATSESIVPAALEVSHLERNDATSSPQAPPTHSPPVPSPVKLLESQPARAVESGTPAATDETRDVAPPPDRAWLLARKNVRDTLTQLARERAILAWQRSTAEMGLAQLQHWLQQIHESDETDWFQQSFGVAQLRLGRRLPVGFTRT
jgi:subtilisin family serine protease